MRVFLRKIGSAASIPKKDESSLFLERIAQMYRKSLANPYIPVFSTQVTRLLHSLRLEEIVLYSLFEGDLSHIMEITLQAKMQRIRLKSRTVLGEDAGKFNSIKKALDMDTLEVIP